MTKKFLFCNAQNTPKICHSKPAFPSAKGATSYQPAGNAPGNASPKNKGLKARPIGYYETPATLSSIRRSGASLAGPQLPEQAGQTAANFSALYQTEASCRLLQAYPGKPIKQKKSSPLSEKGPRCVERIVLVGQLTCGGLGKPLDRGEGLLHNATNRAPLRPRLLSITMRSH